MLKAKSRFRLPAAGRLGMKPKIKLASEEDDASEIACSLINAWGEPRSLGSRFRADARKSPAMGSSLAPFSDTLAQYLGGRMDLAGRVQGRSPSGASGRDHNSRIWQAGASAGKTTRSALARVLMRGLAQADLDRVTSNIKR